MEDDLTGLLEGLGGLGIDMSGVDLSTLLPEVAAETSQQMGYNRRLPPWAQGLAAEVVQDPGFDPYMRVFWGGTKEYKTGIYEPGRAPDVEFGSNMGATADTDTAREIRPEGPKTVSIERAMNDPFTWTDREVADAMQRMREAGIQVNSFDELTSAWSSMVERAARTFSATKGERALTPWDVLDLYKDEAKAAGTWADPNRREVTVNRSVSDVTEGEAWSSIQGTLQQMLGRDPSDQELRDFTYRMNRMAADNPTITRTIQQYKDGELDSTTSRTRGGFTAADMAQEAYEGAQNDPEYAEFQAATTYFSALQQALGAIGG